MCCSNFMEAWDNVDDFSPRFRYKPKYCVEGCVSTYRVDDLFKEDLLSYDCGHLLVDSLEEMQRVQEEIVKARSAQAIATPTYSSVLRASTCSSNQPEDSKTRAPEDFYRTVPLFPESFPSLVAELEEPRYRNVLLSRFDLESIRASFVFVEKSSSSSEEATTSSVMEAVVATTAIPEHVRSGSVCFGALSRDNTDSWNTSKADFQGNRNQSTSFSSAKTCTVLDGTEYPEATAAYPAQTVSQSFPKEAIAITSYAQVLSSQQEHRASSCPASVLPSPVPIPFCTFCKKLGKSMEIVSSHFVKDVEGNNACPYLRNIDCPLCHCSDRDKAHTMKYCPLYRNIKFTTAT